MTKRLFFILFCAGAWVTTLACPFCGCGNSYFQVGILPMYSHGFVGLRYSYSQFSAIGAGQYAGQFSRDYYHSTELWGGYQVGRFQFMAFVPYMSIHELSDDGTRDYNGVSDMTVMGGYNVLSSLQHNSEGIATGSENLWVGAGIKLPTGKSQVDVTNPSFTVGDFASTPGTGSTDFLLSAMHSALFGKNGVVTNVVYRINTKNDQGFRYGNRLYLNSALFHSFEAGTIGIRPSVGANLVVNSLNTFEGQHVDGSNGYILSGLVGLNLQHKKLGFLVNGFLPLAQDQYHGQTHLQGRASVSLTYSF